MHAERKVFYVFMSLKDDKEKHMIRRKRGSGVRVYSTQIWQTVDNSQTWCNHGTDEHECVHLHFCLCSLRLTSVQHFRYETLSWSDFSIFIPPLRQILATVTVGFINSEFPCLLHLFKIIFLSMVYQNNDAHREPKLTKEGIVFCFFDWSPVHI